MKKTKVAVIIPARYNSSRFPGKVLAMLCGKPMIQWVYEKALASKADSVIVATDEIKVAEAVKGFGGVAVMTRNDHPSGTDRIYEASLSTTADIIINVQGDEPLLQSAVIDDLIDFMVANENFEMGTVAVAKNRQEMEDPNKVKVVFDDKYKALYFSRSVIPYRREGGEDLPVYWHCGIYAYRRDTLKKFVELPPSKLENCEKLEQLRALENGISIYVLRSSVESLGVDTVEDLKMAEAKIKASLI